MSTLYRQDTQIASLEEALDRVYRALVRPDADPNAGAAGGAAAGPARVLGPAEAADSLLFHEPWLALQRLETAFGLSSFERDLLLLCAGAGLENRFLSACEAANRDGRGAWPTFGLALSALDDPHWSAISRARPLRYWRLIEVGEGPLLHAPLRIDERILQHLIGIPAVDERLEGLVRPLDLTTGAYPPEPTMNWMDAIDPAVRHWLRTPAAREPVLLVGSHRYTQQSAFMEICRRVNLLPCLLHAADIPSMTADREQLARLWTREFALCAATLYIKTGDADSYANLTALLNLLETPVAIEVRPGSPAERLGGLRIHLSAMSAPERKKVWIAQLGPVAQQMNGYLDRIVEQFHFDEPAIQLSAIAAREEAGSRKGSDAGRIAWQICRGHARRSLEDLAERLEPRGAWEDLVLPPQQMGMLRQIVIHVRRRSVVNDQWGFADRYGRGLGLSALFAGGSGTGKTMAAELIAAELDLDIYRIDLASVVSKYIGETEKNLRRIFDAAEESSAILLFDEADALFGKRSEVRDSHDRYANLEISYLLQRIDSYRGVAILTTNMQHALDSAFMRRIRFIVQFPFPDASSRARIWQRIFPFATPIGAVDFDRLGQLNVSGGAIRNIAMHAAFLAAEDETAIGMAHLLAASRTEYSKMDKPLTGAETRGWV